MSDLQTIARGLASVDPELARVLEQEQERQSGNLELIASENYASPEVLEAAGSILTNKYAEGYPGNRYYGGCEFVDIAEDLARDRGRRLFEAEYVNVQPHSGSTANMAVYFSLLEPGDTIMGMDLAHGGHLTHGAKVNFSGQLYTTVTYGVDRDTERLDYDEIARIAREHRPKLIIAGASAYSRVIDFQAFRSIADEVGAYFLTDMAHIAGPVAAGVHPSPVPHAHFVTTTTHKTLRGPRGGLIIIGSDGPNNKGVVAPKSGRTRNWSELIDSSVMPGVQGGPLMHIIAAKAVALKLALEPSFIDYQRRVVENASVIAREISAAGGRVISGGTDNHLCLVDVTPFGISGKEAEKALDRAHITVNKNGIPFDTRSPLVTSGIRIGTPAVTTRGMGPTEMSHIARFIIRVLESGGDDNVVREVGAEVQNLTREYPLFASN
ncbi:MAG: serine hydroxymethyltransferase [Spirochaetaceae bacterium]